MSSEFKGPEDVIASARKEIENRIHLKVLIFGPGSEGGNVYDKRCEIRQKIKSLGHDADFCEDIWTPQALATTGLNLAVAELLSLDKYDYIVCLMASPGSIAEVHDFADKKKFATKMLICLESQHEKGYSGQGILRIFEGYHGRLDWFKNPEDIDHCYLATRVLEQIKKVAEGKQWELATGGSGS